jgi:hypothetical protein
MVNVESARPGWVTRAWALASPQMRIWTMHVRCMSDDGCCRAVSFPVPLRSSLSEVRRIEVCVRREDARGESDSDCKVRRSLFDGDIWFQFSRQMP